jgi:hypothetical protein
MYRTKRTPTPELATIPAPSGKYPNFAAYIDACVEMMGTAASLGEHLGFSTGSRISDWKNARGGRPSLESCLRLAELTGDDPLDVVTMAGHAEAAAMLKRFLTNRPDAPVSVMLQPLSAVDSAIAALQFAKKKLEER